jgi:hypothetical protein
MPDGYEAEQPPVFVNDRQCVLAGAEHGRRDFRHVIVGSHPWPRSEAEQLVDRQVVSPEWARWPLQRDIPLIEHPDRTDAIVDHDQMPIVFAMQSPPGAEQRRLRIDDRRLAGHHLTCCWQRSANYMRVCVVGFFPDGQDMLYHVGCHYYFLSRRLSRVFRDARHSRWLLFGRGNALVGFDPLRSIVGSVPHRRSAARAEDRKTSGQIACRPVGPERCGELVYLDNAGSVDILAGLPSVTLSTLLLPMLGKRTLVAYGRRSVSTATAPDRVERNITVTAPNQLWVADISYLHSGEGFVYLAIIVGAFSRKVIDRAKADHLRTELVLDAVGMAITSRQPAAGTVRHTDRGSQGGFKRSSQHLDREVCEWDGQEVGLQSRREVAGAAAGGWAGASAATLGCGRVRLVQ